MDSQQEEPGQPVPRAGREVPANAEEELIEELADRYLDDLRAGRIPRHVELILAYPELAVPLVRRLSLLRRLHGASRSRPPASTEPPAAGDGEPR